MTNEELAALAKGGDKAALAQLWEQNRGLLAVLFRRLTGKLGDRIAAVGVSWEDVEQCGFLAIADAVTLYDPQAGVLFSSFLRYPVMSQFFELIGFRTERQKRDPLGRCVSLDEPVTGEDGSATPRGELVPDSHDPFEDAQERLYREQAHTALEQCLAEIDEQQADAIRRRYFDGLTSSEIAACMGIPGTAVRQLEHKGLNALRRKHRQLDRFREDYISTHAYHGTGLAAWRYGGSVEERILERLEL